GRVGEREQGALDRAGRGAAGIVIELHREVAAVHVLVHVEEHVDAGRVRVGDVLANRVEVVFVELVGGGRLDALPRDQQANRVEAEASDFGEVVLSAGVGGDRGERDRV